MTAASPIRTLAVAAALAVAVGAAQAQELPKLSLQKGAPPAAAAADAAPAARPLPLREPTAEPPPATPAPQMKVITLDPTAMARPKPEPRTSELDAAEAMVVGLGMNKTRPIDLPARVNEIVVGNPMIVDVMVRAPDQVFLIAKDYGNSNIFFLDNRGRLVRRIEVNVHADEEWTRAMFQELMPDENIKVKAFGDNIVLSGVVRSDSVVQNAVSIARRFVPGDANIINMLRVAGEQQVLMRVRLAEVRKTVTKELDGEVSIGALDSGRFRIGSPGVSQNGFASVTNPAFFGGRDITGPLGSIAATSAYGIPLAVSMEALEDEGLAKILAEPTLTAVSGEEARVLSGGSIPIGAVEDDDGGITVTYRDFGVSLTFVPVVVGPGRISLKLLTEVSSQGEAGAFGFPILNVRRANTTVELPSGGSMMIAGVLTNDMTAGMAGVPGIMDMPILGALFRSSDFQRDESEMVVTVEAYIVEPTAPKKLALPTDGFVPASDLDRYLLGRLQRVYGKPALPAVGAADVLSAPIGYIVH